MCPKTICFLNRILRLFRTQYNTKMFKELDPDAFYIVFNKDSKYKFYKLSNDKLLKKKGEKWV